MRVDVLFTDRVGIAHEILAVVSRQGLDLTAVEVEPPHLFLDVPALAEPGFARLREHLLAVDDVRSAEPVAMLLRASRQASATSGSLAEAMPVAVTVELAVTATVQTPMVETTPAATRRWEQPRQVRLPRRLSSVRTLVATALVAMQRLATPTRATRPAATALVATLSPAAPLAEM